MIKAIDAHEQSARLDPMIQTIIDHIEERIQYATSVGEFLINWEPSSKVDYDQQHEVLRILKLNGYMVIRHFNGHDFIISW